MKQYFENKLKSIIRDIESAKQNIIKYAQELDIKQIINYTDRLSVLNAKHSEFTKDACLNCTVIEIIEMIGNKLIREYDASYVYKYDKAITTNERDMLTRLSYQFKDAKIK